MNGEPDNLDRALHEMYRRQSLAPPEMQRLLETIAAETPARPLRNLPAFAGAIAAVLVMSLAMTAVFLMRAHPLTARAVAEDVERHHVKPFEQEFAAADMQSLSAQMKDLDFKPAIPDRVAGEQFELIGARHCHVGNTRAVQLRLKDQIGQIRTLCEFRAADTDVIGDGQFTINGLNVNVWHENQLVFAMTGPVR